MDTDWDEDAEAARRELEDVLGDLKQADPSPPPAAPTVHKTIIRAATGAQVFTGSVVIEQLIQNF